MLSGETVSTLFNPTKFFENTAHFASKGRGLFTILNMPKVMVPLSLDPKIIKASQLLRSGIVAKSFDIPSQELATYSPFSYVGPTRKMPYVQTFADITVDFLLTSDNKNMAGALYFYFIKWQEMIAGPVVDIFERSPAIKSDVTNFAVRYYDDYTTDAFASIYTPTAQNDTPAIQVQYTELYPIRIGNLNMSWDADDSPIVLSVSFAYHYSQIKD